MPEEAINPDDLCPCCNKPWRWLLARGGVLIRACPEANLAGHVRNPSPGEEWS